MSIAFLGTPIGIFIFAPMTQWLIDTRGWREAWLALAVIGPLVISVVALGVIRRAPEDLGLRPDGDEALSPGEGSPSRSSGGASSEYSFTRAEAVRTPTFRWLAAVDGLRQVAVATLGLFRIPFYVDQGIDPTVVALALSAEALVGMMITVPVGWLVDRLQPRYVSASATAVMVATFGATIMVSSPAHVFVATILYGG
jgi:Na+/melibiose symporter-like transporter